ncbi:MAG: hypothetical protein ACTS73_07630 [Arsenophonus sp. NEOnobi-MAG3]
MMSMIITPLMFCWKGFQQIFCSNEEGGERSRRTAGIHEFPSEQWWHQ